MIVKMFAALIVVVAIAVSIATIMLTPSELAPLRSFFDICLPILGFGALVKYLCTCRTCKCGACGK